MSVLAEESPSCVLCLPEQHLRGRIINITPLVVSFVPTPWFHEGHVVVAPRTHVVTFAELMDRAPEYAAVSKEIGRLSIRVDDGCGHEVHQKYAPQQWGNDVTLPHAHFHIVPRREDEPGVFAVPRSFDDMVHPAPEKIAEALRKLR